jgi:modification methylase
MADPSPVVYLSNMAAPNTRAELSVVEKFRHRDELLQQSPSLLQTSHELLLGDARTMGELTEDASVHLVVTSPPYWNLKDYQALSSTDQLGDIEDYDAFLEELNKVWQRCYDLLVPGGRLCVVVGDVCLPRKRVGRHHVVPLHADISVYARQIGFDYLTPILWYKIANASTEVEGNGAPFLGKPYEPNAIIKNDVEYILLLRKPGGYRSPSPEQRLLSLIDKKDHARWFRAIWDDVPGASTKGGHPAPFPPDLAVRLIRMFSFVGDTVLDPFVGTGTTSVAALQSNRSSVGYDIEPRFIDIAKRRVAECIERFQPQLPLEEVL